MIWLWIIAAFGGGVAVGVAGLMFLLGLGKNVYPRDRKR